MFDRACRDACLALLLLKIGARWQRSRVINLGGGGGRLMAVSFTLVRYVGLLVGLVRAVDGNFNSDLTTLNLLAVHLRNSFLLQLFGGESDEAEATTLAWLATCLEFLDHKSGNGSKGNLGRRRLVSFEEILELLMELRVSIIPYFRVTAIQYVRFLQ